MARTILMADFQRIDSGLRGRSFTPEQEVVYHYTHSSMAPGCKCFIGDWPGDARQCGEQAVESLVLHRNSEPDWSIPVCAEHLREHLAEHLAEHLPFGSPPQQRWR